MNPGTIGRIPEKVSDRARAIVTAGLAKEVDEVNLVSTDPPGDRPRRIIRFPMPKDNENQAEGRYRVARVPNCLRPEIF